MKKDSGKSRYIMTWVAAALMLLSGILLLVLSWNSSLGATASRMALILTWVVLTASGVYLFIRASGHAQREWIEEQAASKEAGEQLPDIKEMRKETKKEEKELEFAPVARKMVRRIPEETPLEEMGPLILDNLARELEIMSGLFYIEKEGSFVTAAGYAVPPSEEPYSFRPGEGLTGQVARNQQLMVLTSFPEEDRKVSSGLGKATPTYLALVPLVFHQKTVALIECAGYRYDPHDIESMFRIFSRDLMEKIASRTAP